ncbi:hypothetical protein C5B42_00310 [Candidatus Cerribacteria bacterium 'Amazon FNV 2010 28 9']|uniref:NAD-dependent epimerase/dehydratase domain-containing protein n=1 Tax=Candidatus Cerribacteria bacterium 'Amazon FNV 2010 28 9' TaxID=2081795 RepID=A0A317JQG4_9BACT|nr:MAG: hypothetical protein C5B42_00310 [Candidatus Cerribacteria bacterium 'Amazon FNV 2010 28 9']
MKKVLILGGTGYIGSALTSYLQEDIQTVDLEWFGNVNNPANQKIDYDELPKKFFSSFDVVILLAGHSSVAMCEDNRHSSFENNVAKFVRLLDKLDDQAFIYASSSGIYGKTGENIVDETFDRYVPTTYYDLQKKEIDLYASLSSLNYYGLRFGTVNGYAPNLRTDLMINKMFLDAKEYGKIHVSNPHIHRPLLGIADLCRVVNSIILDPTHPGIYNLASFNTQIGEIAQRVGTMMDVPVVVDSPQPSYNFSISTNKFEQQFDFHFQETPGSIVDGLKKYYTKAHREARVKKL